MAVRGENDRHRLFGGVADLMVGMALAPGSHARRIAFGGVPPGGSGLRECGKNRSFGIVCPGHEWAYGVGPPIVPFGTFAGPGAATEIAVVRAAVVCCR